MNEKSPIQQFRDAVYQKTLKRADAGLDLLDALTTAGHVESPVALSEEVSFLRKFSMVYDTLDNGEIDAAALADILCQFQPGDANNRVHFASSYEIARAIINAAAAASPPMSTVWIALRSGGAPVK
jgi:hypothetical protein